VPILKTRFQVNQWLTLLSVELGSAVAEAWRLAGGWASRHDRGRKRATGPSSRWTIHQRRAGRPSGLGYLPNGGSTHGARHLAAKGIIGPSQLRDLFRQLLSLGFQPDDLFSNLCGLLICNVLHQAGLLQAENVKLIFGAIA